MRTDEQLLQDDLQARGNSLDVSRSFIVQAPAGSGKTELLIQRYLKLLSVVDHPEEILAITFTRKAAAEMQLRVLDALRRKRRGDEAEEDHERLTIELAGVALQRDQELGWNLIGNPRRMRIQTLDALSASIARAQPLSRAGNASGVRIVVQAELMAVHRSAAIATLDWIVETGGMQTATTDVLRHVDNNTWLYVSYLSQMLATRDQWLPFVGSGLLDDDESAALRRRFEQSLEISVCEHLERTSAAFDADVEARIGNLLAYAADNMRAAGHLSDPIGALQNLTTLPAADLENIVQWQGLAELLLTKGGTFRKKVDKRQGFPAGDKGQKDSLHTVLEGLAENSDLAALLHGVRTLPPVRYSDDQWEVLLALFRLLPLAVTELRRLFAERGIADHIDIAIAAGAALGTADEPGDVALLLDYQVRHLLVDEMQDTSSAQYRMLEALTGGWEQGDGRSLYCVGDPMQSIYRFRNAEVGQFLLARQYGIGHIKLESLLLRRNFRSGERLVDWFNSVFPSVLAATDDPLRGAVAYSAAVSVPHLAAQGRCIVHPVFGTDSAQEAALGCNVIARTLADNPDDQMAVLVRGRTHLPQLLAHLRKAGIDYRAIEIDRLTDLPEIIDVLALTRAAAHQGDRMAWLGLLRAPWIGLDWSDLHALARNDTQSTIWELLQDDERLAGLSAYAKDAIAAARDVLESLVAPRRTQSLRDLVEKSWIALGGPAALADRFAVENVYRYLDVISRHEHGGTLVDVAELETTLDLERVSSDDNARLHVMTMHRAKGLQFDHVLLFGLGRLPGSGERSVMSWFDMPNEHGEQRKIISPVGPRAVVENDPVHRYIELTAAEKERHEQARLLYVACTRARKSLHLIGNTRVAPDGESFRPAIKSSLLHLLWPVVEAEFHKAFENYRAEAVNTDESIWGTPVLQRLSAPWQLPNVPPVPGSGPGTDLQDAETEVEFYWVGTDARLAGTLVHRWLQLMSEGRVTLSADNLRELIPVSERWLRELGLGTEGGTKIIERVQSAVKGILTDPRGRWILEGNGHSELKLCGVYEGQVAAVVLDRVRIDDDGTHWIIDYKTSSHEGGDLNGFLQAESDRYRPQLARYAAIYGAYANTDARCALYFPILQSFVEVSLP